LKIDLTVYLGFASEGLKRCFSFQLVARVQNVVRELRVERVWYRLKHLKEVDIINCSRNSSSFVFVIIVYSKVYNWV